LLDSLLQETIECFREVFTKLSRNQLKRMRVVLLVGLWFSFSSTRQVFQFTSSVQQRVLNDLFGPVLTDENGRAAIGDGGRRERLQQLLSGLLETEGWLPVRILAMAVSVGLTMTKPVIHVRGPTSKCHYAPVCVDLACGKCYDPMTSLHGDCNELSFFKCSSILPSECLPWTCATGSDLGPGYLRNFLPRSAGCGSTGFSVLTNDNTIIPENVQLTGIGLTMTALTECSEEPVCWDETCGLCYDSLEQYHGQCPTFLSARKCSELSGGCQPISCWPKEANSTVQRSPVILREFEHKDISDILCKLETRA